MQCIYALTQSRDDSLEKQERFLRVSIENTYTLYLLIMSLLQEVHEMAKKYLAHDASKYIATPGDQYPDKTKFVNNKLLMQIAGNKSLLREFQNRKLKNWYLHQDYVSIIYKEIISSSLYESYMQKAGSSYEEDKDFLISLFKEVIAPNEKIYEYFEDDKLTWVDDIPLVNTFIVKLLRKTKEKQGSGYFVPELLKDDEDLEFAMKLLSKTLLNDQQLEAEIVGKTPNWDKDRIAEIDAILLKMAICELLKFSSIPERVTLNEYLEIAKEYSTPKSSIFINGILDKLVKEYKTDGKLKKTGRGLL